jgi:type IV pilus assembly protein PilF
VTRVVVTALLALLVACASQKSNDTSGQSRAETEGGSGSPLERAKIHTELGVGYYENGQLGVALEELNTAVAVDKNYAPAFNALGLVYMELKEDDKAEKNFKQAIKVDRANSEAMNNYGLFLCQRGRQKDGMRLFLDALKNPLYGTPDVAYKNAGLCARKAGDMTTAEEYLRKALKLNPRQPQALYTMAEISYLRDDWVDAKQYMTRYLTVVENPGPEALWLGARVERRLGDRNALANYGMQLRRRYPSSAETKAFLEGRFE